MTNIDSKLFLNVRFINYLEILNCLMLRFTIFATNLCETN